MNVTRANFAEAAGQLEALLPSAAFVAIDEEMTGITLPGQPELVGDAPARRYLKMRNVASRYSIIQFGVCLFHEREDGGGYFARPFNFYLFPEAGVMTMEASSIGFLRDHKMDFNKWIYEGIPYLCTAGAEKLHASLFPQEVGTQSDSTVEKQYDPMVLTKKGDIELTDKAIADLRQWLADDSRRAETEYEVLTTNGYIRRFLYQTVKEHFPQLTAESRPVPGMKGISAFVVLRLDEAARAEKEAQVRAEKEQRFAEKAGFYRVFKALAAAKRPLVGHNCMYDLLFMMSHFEGPLPATYADFRAAFAARFPTLLDTKLLVCREPFKWKPGGERECRFGSTALGEVFKVFQEEARAAVEAGKAAPVEVAFAPGFDRYSSDDSAAHEAGYDAYMTGYAFAHMAREALSPECLASLNGRTPIFRSVFDFTLTGDDAKFYEGVLVHATGLKGLPADRLRGVFSDIKKPGDEQPADLSISWINDDSAFVVLPEVCAHSVAAMLERSRSTLGITLTPGEEWLAAETAAFVEEAAAAVEPPSKRARTA